MKDFADRFASFLKEMIDYSIEKGQKQKTRQKILKKEVFALDDIEKLIIKTGSIDIALTGTSDSEPHFDLWGSGKTELKNVDIKICRDNGTLTLDAADFGDHNLSMRLFLPEKKISLELFSRNGDISISGYSAPQFIATTENGDIICKVLTADQMLLKSENGDIIIEKCEVKEPIQASSQNGDVIE